MAPKYFAENRYAFVIDATRELARSSYEVDTPETAFERDVQRRLVTANRLLAAGRPAAALEDYQSLRGVIASVLYPSISPFVGARVDWVRLAGTGIAEAAIVKSAQMLDRTPAVARAVPAAFGTVTPLSAAATQLFVQVEQAGLADADAGLRVTMAEIQTAFDKGDFVAAAKSAAAAAQRAQDSELRAALLHDQAVLLDRSGQGPAAAQVMQQSIDTFAAGNKHEAQLEAMATLAGMQTRAGLAEAAKATLLRGEELRKKFSVFPVVNTEGLALQATGLQLDLTPAVGGRFVPQLTRPTTFTMTRPFAGRLQDAAAGALDAGAVQLVANRTYAERRSAKTLTVFDEQRRPVTALVAGAAGAGLDRLYATLRDTKDVALLTGYLTHHTVTVAYLGHIIGWVLPMAMGDCHAALGAYEEAESEYLSTLQYKFLNLAVESVVLWLRLAELYLDWGDRLYRNAANVVAEFGAAKAIYERVLKLDNSLNGASPLYAHPTFAAMKVRAALAVQTALVAGQVHDDNPRVTMALARARMQLSKIAGELNFLGMGVHVPPFSWEHLQNLARYFAQHAAQVEQSYIQFKSSGENESLREQQMAQQASVAAASVELERRGLAEAREGVDVANAGLNYATVQRDNATEMRDRFNAVRWELQDLERLQAWAGSVSSDEVKLNVVHSTYYSADNKPRSHVLFDLANRRSQISHDLEAARMQNEIDAANAYRGMAQQQVEQAQARVAVAQQRVQIAGLQAQYAQENLAFLKGREFSATMWYDLAREARRIAQRYQDMAIEVAVLMEKAYEAETGRDLRKIKLDYGLDQLNGLLAADALLLDIDYFSLDFVRTKSKKAPMKQTLSLADHFPMAFDQLIRTGRALFETTLAHFDRRYPGFYLQKVKQVELLFVGLAGTEGVHGTLRNIGLSKFRRRNGTVVNQLYPADVMPLTDYDVRQDAVVFQLSPNELRLFENNGIATVWQIDVPKHSNTFELSQILDVQLVLSYDGFFDPNLESTVLAALPTKGSGTRSFALRLTAPDELFFLRSQGLAQLVLDANLLPANQANPQLKGYFLQARGDAAAGLKLRVDWAGLGAGQLFTLDAQGNADGATFGAPTGRTLFDSLQFSVSAADNPQLVNGGVLDLSGLQDLALFVDYTFDYRT
jgi:Tc toxin complex TcA C-terminal TcB-binding domain